MEARYTRSWRRNLKDLYELRALRRAEQRAQLEDSRSEKTPPKDEPYD